MSYCLNDDVCALAGFFDVLVFLTAAVFTDGLLALLVWTFSSLFVPVVFFTDTGFNSAVFD